MSNMLAEAGRFIAHNPKTVAGLGAGLGATANVAREALSGHEQKNYLGAGLHGAVAGGLAGGAVGGLGRVARDVHLMHPELGGLELAKGTAKQVGTEASNFAQRQVHGLTGYGTNDQKYLDRIGIAGKQTSANKARVLNMRAEDVLAHNPGKADAISAGLHGEVGALHHDGAIAQRFRDLGMTSLPGAMKGAVTNPREASSAIWNQLRSGGAGAAALGVGVPGALGAADVARGDERATGGRSVQEKVMRAGANVGGGLLFGGVGLLPQALGGSVAESAAGRLGRAITPARQPVAPAAI